MVEIKIDENVSEALEQDPTDDISRVRSPMIVFEIAG